MIFNKKSYYRKIAQDTIAEMLLECESVIEYGEALGVIKMAKQLDLITETEQDIYETNAYNKHFAFVKQKELERKRKAEEYKEERKRKAQEARAQNSAK